MRRWRPCVGPRRVSTPGEPSCGHLTCTKRRGAPTRWWPSGRANTVSGSACCVNWPPATSPKPWMRRWPCCSTRPYEGFPALDGQGSLNHPDPADKSAYLDTRVSLYAGRYAGIVRRARRAFEQSHDPFSLDAALDRGYYEGLVQRAQPLEEAVGAPFRSLMANLIDRINLVWLLRYRFNYGLPPAEVYYLLVASHYALSGARLRDLAAQDSLEAVLAALPAAWQARLAGVTDVPDVFARMEHVAAEQALRVLRSRAPGIARAFAYLILRERDLRAVRAVLRGRHLGLPDDDIRLALRRAPVEFN